MSVALEQKQGLIAGDGLLPVKMAQYAKENGFDVVAISLSNDNYAQLKKYCSKVYSFCPGEVQKIEWLDKFFRRMSTALYKWSILPPSVIVESRSINKYNYRQPITSSRINYKGVEDSYIKNVLD